MTQPRLLDLKLLIIFDAVMTERSITGAARRLGMTQPALSNSLARLRDVLNDRLFIRSPRGMRPTPRALELAVPVSQSLRQLQAAIEQRKFVPADANRTFRLAMSPHASTVLMAPLMERLRARAPGIRIRVMAKNNVHIWSMLDNNEIDFVVGVVPSVPKRFGAIELFRDHFVALMRRGHRLSRRPISLKEFAKESQVLLTATGDETSLFDEQLKTLGYRRPVSLIINEYLAAILVISRTDLITALFNRTSDLIKQFPQLSIISRPLPMDQVSVQLVWHPGLSNHPAHDWLRDEIAEVSKSVASASRTA